MNDHIEFVDLGAQRRRLGDRVERAIGRVLDHGKFIMGPEVAELEARLAAYCGVKHAVSCASGTDALLLPLLAWEIGPGDAVLVPSFTFAATAEVVALLDATPVFVDVDPSTFTMDPTSIAAALEVARSLDLRPAAVIPVDLFGHPADYTLISKLAEDAGARVLADGAQSFGGMWDGRRVGCHGHATATSFFPAKPLGCYGDGGAVLTDDDALDEALRSLRVHGQGTDKYDNVRVGINGRLDTIQAAVLLEKLDIFDEELAARRALADAYGEALAGAVRTPSVAASADSAWAQYTILSERRDELKDGLAQAGVPSAVYYPLPLHRQTAYAEFPTDGRGMGVSNDLSTSVLSLPMHPYLDADAQRRIAAAVISVLS